MTVRMQWLAFGALLLLAGCASTPLPDRDFSPIVRVPAIFPQSEPLDCGRVVVEYDISKQGYPENIRIIEATTEKFAAAAIAATKQFKYKSRVVDGKPVVVKGVRHAFRMKIEGATCENLPT